MHIYTLDGKDYPSVTTILQCLGAPELMRWANSLGFRHLKYDDELDKSATFGTKVHEALRGIVDPTYTSSIQFKDQMEIIDIGNIRNRFTSYFKRFSYTTVATEMTIISPELGYAGTLDWLANFHLLDHSDILMLNDFKTSRAVRIKHLLQLGGYYNLLRTQGYDPDGASIILANRKLCAMFPIGKAELLGYADTFNLLAKYYINASKIEVNINQELLNRLSTTS